jgi:hypothetical protein
MKDGSLTDQRSEAAIEKVKKDMIGVGVTLNKATSPIPELGKYRLKIDVSTGEYIFTKGQISKTWKELSKINVKVPYFKLSDTSNLEKSLTIQGKGILHDAFKKLEVILSTFSINVLRRTLSYISSYRADIEIARLSKDGSGTSMSVVLEDVGACQLLLYISLFFPAAISRLTGYTTRFKVLFGPLMWMIRDHIRENLSKLTKQVSLKTKWPQFEDSSGREMRSYQKDALEEMIAKNKMGKKGHFLWMTVGLGKSLVVLSYLQYLVKQKGNTPEYILYALPKSALKSIITEIEYFGVPINLLLPIKSWKTHPDVEYVQNHNTLLPRVINIIEHDHLRVMEDELITKASQTILVIDEVHKALNDTKRTSVALELSRLSIDFVALTGTPVVDSNTYKLIWWMEQIVDFEVNEDNFWVAANAMISKKINTGVSVNKSDVLAKLNDSEDKLYRSLIPVAMGGTNQKASTKDIIQAFDVCYKACDREMIKLTMSYVTKKLGVMLVGKNIAHINSLKDGLASAGLKTKDIFVMNGKESIFLTDETVSEGSTPDYKVVIVPLNKSAGYTLTRMRVMITSVYPSNNATREQLEGRINRVSQHAKEIFYHTVHTGILTYVLQKHKDAQSLSLILSSLAKEVGLD